MDRNPVRVDAACVAGVALRKESVDRNWYHYGWRWYDDLSLSARRAWIEIDVDSASGTLSDSRSPQGERG